MGRITKIKIALSLITNLFSQVKLRGWYDAILLTIIELRILFSIGNKENLYAKKHKLNLEFLTNNFPLSKYKLPEEKVVETKDFRIWVLWWQGESQMPPIVKATYNSIVRNSGKKVVLITELNYRQYIDIPEVILVKVNKGVIKLPALSDFIRMSLLDRYGGMWIDSTILLVKPLYEEFFSTPLYSIADRQLSKIELGTQYVAGGRWNVQFLATNQIHYPLFSLMREIWIDYWSKYNALIDYLLVDYTIAYIVNKSKLVKNDIDSLPETNHDMHSLRGILNCEYSADVFDSLLRKNEMFKLTYKGEFKEIVNGKETFYQHIIRQREQ